MRVIDAKEIVKNYPYIRKIYNYLPKKFEATIERLDYNEARLMRLEKYFVKHIENGKYLVLKPIW